MALALESVGVIVFAGSFCPPTKAHTQALKEARSILMGRKQPVTARLTAVCDACIALVSCDNDQLLRRRIDRVKCAEPRISKRTRENLFRLATASDRAWIEITETWPRIADLESSFPKLAFTSYALNGADDVLVDRKWVGSSKTRRLITMGRGEYTDRLLQAASKYQTHADYFIVGPNLPDISCTLARKALRSCDQEAVHSMLCKPVVSWLQTIRASPYSKFYRAHLPRLVAEARSKGLTIELPQ